MNPLLLVLPVAAIAAVAAASSKKSPSSANVELDATLPPALQAQVLGALANETDPNKLMALSQQMAAQGFPLAATALATRAAQLNVAPRPQGGGGAPPRVIPPPGVIPQPSSVPTLDGSIDPQTAAAVLQALATETDPNKLAQFSGSLQSRFPIAAALLMAKAQALGFNPNQPAPAPAPAQPAVFVPPPPSPPPAPAPFVPPPPPPPAPPASVVMFDAAQLQPRFDLHTIMTSDEWEQFLVLLNDYLNANAADPKISFIDLSWFRDAVQDLNDQGNFQLGLEAMYSLQFQNNAAFGNPANSEIGIADAPTMATLFQWAQTNPGANTANMAVLGPFFNGLLGAVKKGTATAGVRTGWKGNGRYLPPKLALRRVG